MEQSQIHPDEQAFLRYLEYLLVQRKAGQRWPPYIFEPMLRVLAHASWEAVPTRQHGGKLQLLYKQRPPDHPAYPADPVKGPQWCFGGTNNRGESSAVGFARICAEDFQGGRLINPRLVGCINWHQEPRGPGVGLVFLCEYVGDLPPHAQWFDWDQRPGYMVDGHRVMAERIIEAIRNQETTPWFVDYP